MSEKRNVMVKVVLVGDKGVGKTSLIRRFVLDQFDDRYLLTLGAKVEKKVVDVPVPDRDMIVTLGMNIWDIMGQTGLRELTAEAYFQGARGILAVVDLTRKDTLDNVGKWVSAVEGITGPVPMVLVANKNDLVGKTAFGAVQVIEAAKRYKSGSFLASARTGENVEAAFQELAKRVVRVYLGS